MLKKAHAEDDVIVIYAAVTGYDQDGNLRSIQQYIYPLDLVHDESLLKPRTAAPLVECARLLTSGDYRSHHTEPDCTGSYFRRDDCGQAYHVDMSNA
jgi:hypothetical protein